MIAFITVLFFAVNADAGELMGQDDTAKAVPRAAPESQLQDINNPESTLLTVQQQESPQSKYFGRKTDRPVSAHKTNFFSVNRWPADENAQVKYQISMKFRVLEPNLYVLKYNLFPVYFAYTQQTLWNVGRKSMPYEETNYNPELFLDYQVNATIFRRLKLRNIVICPIEHESNGLADDLSRSWNREYVLIKFGLESKERLQITNSFLADKAQLYVKLWYAWDYSDQDAYLRTMGKNDNFLNYMGQGEIGISIRNFLWGGILKDHQLDIQTPIFRDIHKDSYKLEFRQQLPNMNFAVYMQFWSGYGETLMRFDQRGRRGFVGLSFSY